MLVLGTKYSKIYVAEPHPSSRAAYVLLKWEYEKQMRAQWEAFRNAFFDKHEPLTCFYCGATNLLREIPDQSDRKLRKMFATIDHLVALTHNGSQYDEDNCVVACHPCNTKKQDKKIGTPAFNKFIKSRIKQYSCRLSADRLKALQELLTLAPAQKLTILNTKQGGNY